MLKSNIVRMGLMSSAAALALVGAATSAQAVETSFGDVSIVFDTTVSVGASMRTASRETQFLPEFNGGPVDPRSGVGDSLVIPGAAGVIFATDLTASLVGIPGSPGGPSFSGVTTGQLRWTSNLDNFDGSVSADDARLNYDSGDLIGGNVKANHDLVVKWQNYTIFARAVGFYDVVMNDEGVGARSQITDAALGDVGRNYELLDLFLSADYTIADLPVNLRLGKQVINWGESTFILGGNNVFNPIDVGAFRRPGSEIKEALVPVNAFSGSISLPFDVSLSGYYALDWEPFELDASGTPFSTSDVVTLGTGQGGNVGRAAFLSGSPLTGPRRSCDLGAADGNGGLSTIYVLGLLPNPTGIALPGFGAAATGVGNGRIDCLDSPFVNKDLKYTLGQHEATRLGLIDTLGAEGFSRISSGILSRDNDIFPDDHGQFGVSAKWYAESLGGTEFSFYYQNYASRLPFVSERAGRMTVGVAAGSHSTQTASASAKLAGPTGCLPSATNGPGSFADPRLGSDSTPLTPLLNDGLAPGALAGVAIADPQNLLNPVSLATAFAITGANPILGVPTPTAFNGGDNVYNAAVLNCALMLFQSRVSAVTGAPTLFDGAEALTYASDLGLYIEYPEDIEALGVSFNTVLFGWGVQGDFTYRDDAPFQVDTDSVTIAGAMEQCAFATVGDLMATFEALGTYKGHTCFSGGTFGNENISGVLRNQMFTAQIGTTATFTASEWWMEALGADIGILVTEVGLVLVPGVEDTWISKTGNANLQQQYQNIGCQGSDLPLGGLLGLDFKKSKQCRPNDFSAGLVALLRLDYNNAFDTGFLLSPQIVYAYDFEGTTPAPYGNYLEDRQSIGLSLTGTLNNNFRVGASYSNFFGGHIANKSKDTDFASLTASYTY